MNGETLAGRYAIERLLGEGAMGSVYEARHTGTHRRVAVKVISGELLQNDQVLKRFELEARAAGAIESQHIAQVLDVGRDDEKNLPFLVMELLVGEDLTQLTDRAGILAPDLVARVAAQACSGLTRAHQKNVVHRDIKPGNLFLADHEEGDRIVKLLDFGIAKVLSDAEQGAGVALTRTGNLVGTPLYMSPEQARGDKVIDARADVWSLGVVMYQMLVGRTPHDGVDSLGQLIIQICSQPASPLADEAPWVPSALADVVMRSIEIDPEARFQSAEEMGHALKAMLPNGTGITEAMLVGISNEEKAKRPPRDPGARVARSAPGLFSRSSPHATAVTEPPTPIARSSPSIPPPGASPAPAADRPAGWSIPPPGRGVTGTALMDASEVPRPPGLRPSVMPPGMLPPPPSVPSQVAMPSYAPPPSSLIAQSMQGGAAPMEAAPVEGGGGSNRALIITIAAGVLALGAFTAYRLASQSATPEPPSHVEPKKKTP